MENSIKIRRTINDRMFTIMSVHNQSNDLWDCVLRDGADGPVIHAEKDINSRHVWDVIGDMIDLGIDTTEQSKDG